MECGTCEKPEGKGEETRIHREQDRADRSRHDDKQHQTRERRDEYRRGNGRRAHIYARRY